MKKRNLMLIISILSISQANAGSIIKCVDHTGWMLYSERTSKNGKALMSVIACDDLSKNTSSDDLQQRTQRLLDQYTDQEREDAVHRLAKVKASIKVDVEEAAYRIKVREIAKFLNDVEAARKENNWQYNKKLLFRYNRQWVRTRAIFGPITSNVIKLNNIVSLLLTLLIPRFLVYTNKYGIYYTHVKRRSGSIFLINCFSIDFVNLQGAILQIQADRTYKQLTKN